MELCTLVSSLKYLVSNGRQVLLGGIRLGGSAIVLTQEDEGKEYVIAYLGRHLLDPETRYAHIGKLCLSLYYACA